MLRQSFVHLPGIGPAKERNLWDKGILSWDGLAVAAPSLFRGDKLQTISKLLKQSEQAYRSGDLYFFYESMPRQFLWRMVPGFIDGAAYLDIETTGMGFPPMCESTTITFYHRSQIYQEHAHEKKRKLIRKILAECSLLVTFFGEAFDVPFLQNEFGIRFEKAHLDLCFWLKRHGYKGGLKKVQKLFPSIPARLSLDIDGFDAVRLWRMHQKGVPGALETLLTYNAEDTIVLEPLLVEAFNLELAKEPMAGKLERLEHRPFPEVRTRVYPEIYSLLRT